MHLNSLSKHGVIVGIITALCGLMLLISRVPIVKYILTNEDDYDLSIDFIVQNLGILVLSFVAFLLSGFMIWGILKHRHMLLVPWLIFYALVFVALTFKVLHQTFSQNDNQLDDFLFCFIVMGFGIIVIYPLYILYLEIHRENMEILEEMGTNYTYK